MPHRSVTTTGVAAAAASAAAMPKLSPADGRHSTSASGVKVEGRLGRRAERVHAARCLRRAHLVDRAVTVVRPDEHEMDIGELACGGEQMFDALAGGDTPHVEDDRRSFGDAELAPQDAARSAGIDSGIGEAVAPYPHASSRHAARPDVLRLTLGADDDGCRAARDPAVERRVEPRLSVTLRSRGSNIPSGSNTYGIAPGSRPRRHAGRDGIAEAEHVHDVGSLQPPSAKGSDGVMPIQR